MKILGRFDLRSWFIRGGTTPMAMVKMHILFVAVAFAFCFEARSEISVHVYDSLASVFREIETSDTDVCVFLMSVSKRGETVLMEGVFISMCDGDVLKRFTCTEDLGRFFELMLSVVNSKVMQNDSIRASVAFMLMRFYSDSGAKDDPRLQLAVSFIANLMAEMDDNTKCGAGQIVFLQGARFLLAHSDKIGDDLAVILTDCALIRLVENGTLRSPRTLSTLQFALLLGERLGSVHPLLLEAAIRTKSLSREELSALYHATSHATFAEQLYSGYESSLESLRQNVDHTTKWHRFRDSCLWARSVASVGTAEAIQLLASAIADHEGWDVTPLIGVLDHRHFVLGSGVPRDSTGVFTVGQASLWGLSHIEEFRVRREVTDRGWAEWVDFAYCVRQLRAVGYDVSLQLPEYLQVSMREWCKSSDRPRILSSDFSRFYSSILRQGIDHRVALFLSADPGIVVYSPWDRFAPGAVDGIPLRVSGVSLHSFPKRWLYYGGDDTLGGFIAGLVATGLFVESVEDERPCLELYLPNNGLRADVAAALQNGGEWLTFRKLLSGDAVSLYAFLHRLRSHCGFTSLIFDDQDEVINLILEPNIWATIDSWEEFLDRVQVIVGGTFYVGETSLVFVSNSAKYPLQDKLEITLEACGEAN